MPVPTEELKLEIVNAATGQPLGTKAAPSADGALVVRDYPDDGPSPERWQLTPARNAQDDQAYVVKAVSGKVLDHPAGADRGVRQWDAAAGKKNQQWHIVPVQGGAGLYCIEDVVGGSVLDLDDSADSAEGGKDGTRIVLREYDDSAESQRWRFVTAEPDRISDPVLRWAPLSHWNGRQSWRLARSTALRPTPDAAPSFSDVLLVLDRFGSKQEGRRVGNRRVQPLARRATGSLGRPRSAIPRRHHRRRTRGHRGHQAREGGRDLAQQRRRDLRRRKRPAPVRTFRERQRRPVDPRGHDRR
ncbi:hypothetical protein SALBM135S_08568 [Streptomyces alboniger]